MKNYILLSAAFCIAFTGYIAGQNISKEKPVEPCCCKHLQQIAEDIRQIKINTTFEDPGPYESLGLPKSPGELKLPEFKPANPNGKLNIQPPKKPKPVRY